NARCILRLPTDYESGDSTKRPARSARLATIKIRVKLGEELHAPLRLVVLPDGSRSVCQTVKRPQESAIRLVLPSHVAAPAPSRLAQLVEAAVESDPEVRVRLG